MKPAHLRQLTVVLVAVITVGWGGYAGYHARHWLGDGAGADGHGDSDGQAPGVVVSTHLLTQPFEVVMGPVVRQSTVGVAAGEAVQFDLDAAPGTQRVVALVEWVAESAAAESLLVRVAWRSGDTWSEPVEQAGASPLYVDVDAGGPVDAVELTILPEDGLVQEQPVSGWVAFHAARAA